MHGNEQENAARHPLDQWRPGLGEFRRRPVWALTINVKHAHASSAKLSPSSRALESRPRVHLSSSLYLFHTGIHLRLIYAHNDQAVHHERAHRKGNVFQIPLALHHPD